MAEEIKEQNNESEQKIVTDNVDYIEALKEMKNNTVDKATYEKLKDEHNKLLKSFINGEKIDVQQEETVDIEKLRNDLFNKECTNLEYVTNALKLRDAIMEKGGKDPFLPYGEKILPTDEDIATANRVATALREAVEYADGDSNIFTNELQRIMVDTGLKPGVKRR
jgi:hypothetical protein